MFNGKKIESLEMSITTLTEELEKANNTIEGLFSNFEEAVSKLNEVVLENDKLKEEIKLLRETDFDLAEKFDVMCINHNGLADECKSLCESLNIYGNGVDKTIEEMGVNIEKSGKDNAVLKEEIGKLVSTVSALEEKSNNADKEHDELLAVLKDNNERLIKKCDELQLSNVQIMNQHNDMIKRYEQSIKEYAEQTERMKNNVLKKMNANNIISVVEE